MKKNLLILCLTMFALALGTIITAYADNTIPQSQITVQSVSGSYMATTYPPTNVLDGNKTTFWTSATGLPQNIVLNLGSAYIISKVRLVPSQYASIDDSILSYKLYASIDGQNFTVVKSEAWADDPTRAEKTILLDNVIAKYIKFEALTAKRQYLVIGEMNVEGVIAENIVSITTLTPRQIIQRNDENKANVNVSGSYYATSNVDSIEISAALMSDALGGESVDWKNATSFSNGNFNGELQLQAGGWYEIKVRVKCGETYITNQVQKIGIGDIFITAGQSNSASFGQDKTTPVYDTISTWDPNNNSWVLSADSQVSWAGSNVGNGGSPWPTLGDYLTQKYKVPIGFISSGWGSSVVADFLPENNLRYTRLKTPLQNFGKNGIKAVLWHQGESDAISGTSAEVYTERLLKIINQSRIDAGYDVPWVIATASYHTSASATIENQNKVVQGQIAACNGVNIFQGPNTNDMLAGYRSTADGVHFQKSGLIEHGLRWGAVLSKKIYKGTESLYIGRATVTSVNNSYNIALNVTNTDSTAKNFIAYVALYGKGDLENQLIQVKKIEINNLSKNQVANIIADFNELDMTKQYKGRIFIWTQGGQEPISLAINTF